MKLDTNKSTEYLAEVAIRRNYDYDIASTPGSNQEFHGWFEKSPTGTDSVAEIPFAATRDPEQLQDIIYRAQLAILNPNTDAVLYAPGREFNDDREAEFSPNMVCITISKPDNPVLSFYDLPGIIGQSDDEDTQFLPGFVESLVKKYIEDKESVILVTCALSNDIYTSRAGGIARDLKATSQCVGKFPCVRLDKVTG